MGKDWTAKEDAKLVNLYKKYGSNWKKISELLSERTADAVKRHAYILERENKISIEPADNLSNNANAWTAEEDEKLVDLFMKFGRDWTTISEYFNARSYGAVKTRAAFLKKEGKLHYETDEYSGNANAWTVEEDAILVDSCAKFGRDWSKISELLNGRTLGAVRRRALLLEKEDKLSLPFQIDNLSNNANAWTVEEDEKLVDLCTKFGRDWTTISEHFNSRTCGAVKSRAALLRKYDKLCYDTGDHSNNTNAWTAEEDAMLVDSCTKFGRDWSKVSELVDGRTLGAVKKRALILEKEDKLSLPSAIDHSKAWTEKEDSILKHSFKKFDSDWAKISKRLDGRTVGAVKRRAATLKLKRKK